MRIVFDVVGDAVLSALPANHRMGITARVEARLSRVLDQIAGAGSRRVVVLSHSLGAFFAGRVHAEKADARPSLVTIGSPQTTLHRRFLGLSRTVQVTSVAMPPWRNLYRGDDYWCDFSTVG